MLPKLSFLGTERRFCTRWGGGALSGVPEVGQLKPRAAYWPYPNALSLGAGRLSFDPIAPQGGATIVPNLQVRKTEVPTGQDPRWEVGPGRAMWGPVVVTSIILYSLHLFLRASIFPELIPVTSSPLGPCSTQFHRMTSPAAQADLSEVQPPPFFSHRRAPNTEWALHRLHRK